jgi:hypothetical protein
LTLDLAVYLLGLMAELLDLLAEVFVLGSVFLVLRPSRHPLSSLD